jgi:ATP-binding cassette subfamily F protein 3
VVDWPGTYDEYLAVAGDGDAPGLSHLSDFDAQRHQAAQKAKSSSPIKAPVSAPAPVPASKAPDKPTVAAPEPVLDRAAQKEERRKRKRLEELEARIAKLDEALKDLDRRLSQPGFFDDYDVSSKALAEREKLAAEQEAAWAEVELLG